MNQFELYKSLPKEVDKSLRFLINQSSVGIHWKFTDADTLLEAQFFMEFFRDQIQSIGYQKQLADKRIFETSNGLETIERYYLKPPFKLDEAELTHSLFLKVIDQSNFYTLDELDGIWEGLISKLKQIIGA